MGIVETDHAFKLVRVAARKRRCKLRKYLNSAVPVIHVDIFGVIIDYVYASRKVLDFMYNIVTYGGPITDSEIYLDSRVRSREYIDEHIIVRDVDKNIISRHSINMIMALIDLRLGSQKLNIKTWNMPGMIIQNVEASKHFRIRDKVIEYINMCIQP